MFQLAWEVADGLAMSAHFWPKFSSVFRETICNLGVRYVIYTHILLMLQHGATFCSLGGGWERHKEKQ
jgi:hypothetical protein